VSKSQPVKYSAYGSNNAYRSSSENPKQGAPVVNGKHAGIFLAPVGPKVIIDILSIHCLGLLVCQGFDAHQDFNVLSDHAEIEKFAVTNFVSQTINSHFAVETDNFLAFNRRMVFNSGKG
jgi:hypothetical protein